VKASLIPTTWQRDALVGLARRLLVGSGGSRAALVQLPTGFGKSLVATLVFDRLRKRHPRTRLVVVLPNQNDVPRGWRDALQVGDEWLRFGEWLSLKDPGAGRGYVMFETHRYLNRAMLAKTGGRPTPLARELTSRRCLVVIDEVHRARRLRRALAEVFAAVGERRELERGALTTPFRAPLRGKRRAWPRWLLLSATPYNPVLLEGFDPADTRKTHGHTWSKFDAEREADAILGELESTLGSLAWLAGATRGEWFNEHRARARARLVSGMPGPSLTPPAQLIVWPESVRQGHFLPSGTPRYAIKPQSPDAARVDLAVKQLVDARECIHSVDGEGHAQSSTADRVFLSAAPRPTSVRQLERLTYSKKLVDAIRRARRSPWKPNELVKVESLLQFIGRVGDENVLVFTVHRAVARRIAELLRSVDHTDVREAFEVNPQDQKWFRRKARRGRRVLVVTDACSESIDLHQRANILVHYELPWSPLRVMQRVGRLWRLRPDERRPGRAPKAPRLPGIVHFAHPGSVDEEILNRLHRRWGYLSALGLDYLSFHEALGTRLPAVLWCAEG